MDEPFTIELRGLDEALKAFDNLKMSKQVKIVKRMLTAGAQPILGLARIFCPFDEGDLRASLAASSVRKRRGRFQILIGTAEGLLRAVAGKQTARNALFTGSTFYAGFIEFGHFIGKRRLGNKRTWVPANPFLRTAFDQGVDSAISAMGAIFKAEVERAAAAAAKSAARAARKAA